MPATAASTPAPPPHVRVEVLSQPRYLSGARDLVAAVAHRLGFDEGACGQIALAVDEALCNVIRHGYKDRPDGRIWLSIWPQESGAAGAAAGHPAGVRIVIEDEGEQVDPALIKGRDLDEIRPGGLGVHIMRQVMDSVTFERRPEGGMRLTMTKAVPEPADGERG